jgi:twitching motility protein PilT
MESSNNQEIAYQKVVELKKWALDQGASDIFLSAGSLPAYRQHGRTIFREKKQPLTSHLLELYLYKVMTENQLSYFKKHRDIDFAIYNPIHKYRMRVNAFQHAGGISIVFRYIPVQPYQFKTLNLPESLKKIAKLKNGLVLITGAMGSGKSTTLAAIIDLINSTQRKHIVTIEDPVEFVYQNKKSLIEQRELGIHTQDFQTALKSCLRQATDVILVGELRNLETIQMAITAAETGALVLATLHTNGVSKTINRLIDVFPAGQQDQIKTQLSTNLQCIVWQTLLPIKNKIGRVAAFEILFKNYAVSQLIRDDKAYQLPSILETHQREGMMSMKQNIEYLLKHRIISIETASSTLPEYAGKFKY